MKRTQRNTTLLALCLTAALALSACGLKPAPKEDGSSSAAASHTSQEQTEHTVQGTVNLLDEELELLVLLSEEVYYKFDTAGADVSGIAPGDAVTVTYTGTLDPDGDVTAVLVSVAKEAA